MAARLPARAFARLRSLSPGRRAGSVSDGVVDKGPGNPARAAFEIASPPPNGLLGDTSGGWLPRSNMKKPLPQSRWIVGKCVIQIGYTPHRGFAAMFCVRDHFWPYKISWPLLLGGKGSLGLKVRTIWSYQRAYCMLAVAIALILWEKTIFKPGSPERYVLWNITQALRYGIREGEIHYCLETNPQIPRCPNVKEWDPIPQQEGGPVLRSVEAQGEGGRGRLLFDASAVYASRGGEVSRGFL